MSSSEQRRLELERKKQKLAELKSQRRRDDEVRVQNLLRAPTENGHANGTQPAHRQTLSSDQVHLKIWKLGTVPSSVGLMNIWKNNTKNWEKQRKIRKARKVQKFDLQVEEILREVGISTEPTIREESPAPRGNHADNHAEASLMASSASHPRISSLLSVDLEFSSVQTASADNKDSVSDKNYQLIENELKPRSSKKYLLKSNFHQKFCKSLWKTR